MDIKKITYCLELFRQTGCTTNLIDGAVLCGQKKGVEVPLILVGTDRNKKDYATRFENGLNVEFITVSKFLSLIDMNDFADKADFFYWINQTYTKSNHKINKSLFVDISAIYTLLFMLEKEHNYSISDIKEEYEQDIINLKKEHNRDISYLKEEHHKEIHRIKDICVAAFSLLYRHDID